MKLQKASKPIITYPKREHIKPILLSATVAMTLTACTPGKMPNNTQESNCSVYAPSHVQEEETRPPEIAGYMPIFTPEENNQTWSNNPQK